MTDPPTSEPDWAWSTEVEAADWWTARLEPWLDPGIRSIVPSGFEAVTRIFHPIDYADGSVGSWAALAEASGREAHPWMQLHAIATPAGQAVELPIDHPLDPDASEGHLPDPPRSALVRLLTDATDDPDRCRFGVWDGYGQLRGGRAVARLTSGGRGWWRRWRRERTPIPGRAPTEILAGPRIRAPSRDYLALRGPLTAVEAMTGHLGRQCPNLWWPEDRSWFLVTEIDFAWTYLAGPESLVAAVEADEAVEALRTDLDHSATHDSDERNR